MNFARSPPKIGGHPRVGDASVLPLRVLIRPDGLPAGPRPGTPARTRVGVCRVRWNDRQQTERRAERRARMSKADSLRVGDVRDAYRLIGDCRDLRRNPERWHRRMLEGLAGLFGVLLAAGGEAWWHRPH